MQSILNTIKRSINAVLKAHPLCFPWNTNYAILNTFTSKPCKVQWILLPSTQAISLFEHSKRQFWVNMHGIASIIHVSETHFKHGVLLKGIHCDMPSSRVQLQGLKWWHSKLGAWHIRRTPNSQPVPAVQRDPMLDGIRFSRVSCSSWFYLLPFETDFLHLITEVEQRKLRKPT